MIQSLCRGGSLLLVAMGTTTINGGDIWKVQNNFDRDFKLEVRSSGDALVEEYKLVARETIPIRLREDAHTLVTELDVEGPNKQRQESSKVRLRQIADRGVTNLKTIRSPIDIKMPGGEGIYQAMPGYPYSDKYKPLIDNVRNSRWSGKYGGKQGRLTLRGDKGSADFNTKLNNIQYVPSEDQLVVAGEWEHSGENGEFILIIDVKNPTQLIGHYRTKDRRSDRSRWYSGEAELDRQR